MNADFLAAIHPVTSVLPHIACATAETIVGLFILVLIAGWLLGSGAMQDMQDRAEAHIMSEFDQDEPDHHDAGWLDARGCEVSPDRMRALRALGRIDGAGDAARPGGAA